MIGGAALASRAIGDAVRRDLATSWGGPDPRGRQIALPIAREGARRLTVRKP